jgi:hypothetical protein
MAIAGIEGLAQGFMQGMALKRQNDRQDVLDAQNLEKFGMDKERFATQQAASAFDLQNAQTNAANAAMDRTRALGIQKKGDDFEANLGRIYSAGTPEGELMELEKIHQGSGVKGAWARDAKTGGLVKNKDGKFRWVNEDGTAYDASVEDAVGAYIAKVKPLQKAESDMKTASEIASENRKEKTTIAAEGRAAKTAKEKDERDYQQAISLENVKARNAITELERKGALKVPKDYLSKLSQQSFFEVKETIDPTTKEKKLSKPIFNQAKYDQFTLFAHQYNINPDDTAYRLWRKYVNEGNPQAGSTVTSGTDTYDSPSQGKLVAKGLDPEVDAVDVSGIAPVSVEKPSAVKASTAKPTTPKGLTVQRPSSSTTPAKTYKGNAGTMLPEDYLAALGVAIKNGMPVMPPPKQYPKGTTFFGNNANPLDQTIILGTK